MTLFDRLFKTMVTPWVALSVLGFIGLSILFVDKAVALYCHALALGHYSIVLRGITVLGFAPMYIGVLIALLFFFRYVRRSKDQENRVWFLLLCFSLSNVICLVLKITLGRARPALLFDQQIYGFYGLHKHAAYWSFPSGHTTTVMSLAFGLCVLFPRYCYAFIGLGLSVVVSRVVLTEHYLSDVVMAMDLVILEIGLLLYWMRRNAWLSSVYRTR